MQWSYNFCAILQLTGFQSSVWKASVKMLEPKAQILVPLLNVLTEKAILFFLVYTFRETQLQNKQFQIGHHR